MIGFYIERICDLQNDSSKGDCLKACNAFFACFYVRYTSFLMKVKKNVGQCYNVLQRNTGCLSFVATNIITNMFHNHKQTTP